MTADLLSSSGMDDGAREERFAWNVPHVLWLTTHRDGNRDFSLDRAQEVPEPESPARARATEELGFDGLFLVAHFSGLSDVSEPTHEECDWLAVAPLTRDLRLLSHTDPG